MAAENITARVVFNLYVWRWGLVVVQLTIGRRRSWRMKVVY